MIPNTSFYFLRHGETDFNKQGIIMGSMDEPLNQQGIEQAKSAQTILKSMTFSRILCSPRKRARQTAEHLGLDIPLTIIDDLSERSWGEAEGKSYFEYPELFNLDYTPKGGESVDDFTQRIAKCLKDNLCKNDLVVSHGGVFIGLCLILKLPRIPCMNATPYYFKAPELPYHPWRVISSVEGDK